MKNIFPFLSVVTLFAQGCSSDDSAAPPPPVTSPDPDPEVSSVKLAENATFGKILTDSDGKTPYFFSLDTKDTSECLDGCLNAWPVFFQATISVDAGLDTSDFATIDRTDRTEQTTYKGWPLYYFASDNAARGQQGNQFSDAGHLAHSQC